MDAAGREIWSYLVEAYDSAAELVVANLLWFVLTLLVITAPPAAAALYYVTNQSAHGRSISWRMFFDAFRRYFWLGWRWGLLNLGVLAILTANYLFYGQFRGGWVVWARGGFLGLTILWLIFQVYTFPLLFEQQEMRLLLALRNSLVIFLQRPGFSLGLIVFLFVLVLLSILVQIPWILFTGSLGAFLVNRSVLFLLKDLGYRTPKSGSQHGES